MFRGLVSLVTLCGVPNLGLCQSLGLCHRTSCAAVTASIDGFPNDHHHRVDRNGFLQQCVASRRLPLVSE